MLTADPVSIKALKVKLSTERVSRGKDEIEGRIVLIESLLEEREIKERSQKSSESKQSSDELKFSISEFNFGHSFADWSQNQLPSGSFPNGCCGDCQDNLYGSANLYSIYMVMAVAGDYYYQHLHYLVNE